MSLRDGVLRAGIGQTAFRREWGDPDGTIAVLSGQELAAKWGSEVTSFLKPPVEVWTYDRYGVRLLFEDGDLAAWKNDRTKEQLKEIPAKRAK